ncbi:MAG: L,D-transpeptidase family protein, partial [Clostridiales bacterium]|nr:L,D-transpeptidase family protein [Clostridiales bacterium]
KDYGIEVTGEVDQSTYEQIMLAPFRALRKKNSGEDVKKLQSRLTELEYYHGKISGNYLDGTYSAIGSFQGKHHLPVTGEADIETLTLLYSNNALGKNHQLSPVSATAPPANPTPTPGPNDVIVPDIDDPSSEDQLQQVPYVKKLQSASTGNEVLQLQTKLTELGYYEGPLSGGYYKQTIAAVKAFQEKHHLSVDGITGKITWNTLFNNTEVLPASATPKPTPEPTPVPYALTVDVANQVIHVYGLDEKNQHTKLEKQMICSTGTEKYPSDVGDWELNGRTARWAYFPKWGSHAQYWTRINSSIAFHSVIYNSVNTMDLSVKSYNKLGAPASHGCIRLLVEDAKWVYDNVGKGTIVTIREDLPEDPELMELLKPPKLDRSVMLPSQTPQPTPLPQYDGSTPPTKEIQTLKKGSKGEEVYWLQMKLKELGYYQGTVTGAYHQGTANAVKAYQKDHGLKSDGTAGKSTLEHLYDSLLPAEPIVIPIPTKSS